MPHLPWRPRMGATTTVLLLTGLLGIIGGTQVPRLMEPTEAPTYWSEYQAPLDQVNALKEIRPTLAAIHESLAAGKMSMKEAVRSVDSLISGTSLEISPSLFNGEDQHEKIANMTIYWVLEPISGKERRDVKGRLNAEFRTLFGRDCRLPAGTEATLQPNSN